MTLQSPLGMAPLLDSAFRPLMNYTVLSIYCCIAYDFFSIPHDLSLLSLQFIAAFAWIYCCIPN